MIGGGHKVKLTAILYRLTHVAGQRCYVRVSVVNQTKKSVKSLTLTLIRTTILFNPKPALDYSGHSSADPDACQTATSHKVVAENILERSHGVTKGHASAEGWWTGVSAGQEAQFAHYVLIPVRCYVSLPVISALTIPFPWYQITSSAKCFIALYPLLHAFQSINWTARRSVCRSRSTD